MKKIAFVFTFFLLLGAGAVSAQKTFRFGLQVSPSWTWMRTDDKKIEGTSSNWGVKLGVIGEYYFASNYAFMVGLGFGFNEGGSLQNGYYEGDFWTETDIPLQLRVLPMNAKLHYRLNYVEVPFGLKLRGGSGEDNPLKYYIEVPTITLGFLSKATGDIRGSNITPGNEDDANDIPIRDEAKALSLSWGLGGGIEYEFAANATVVAGLAYQQQFTDATADNGMVRRDANSNFVEESAKATIRGLTFRVGIFF